MSSDGWIDRRRYCVWVEAKDLPRIGERVRAFHASLMPESFRELQAPCRRLWLD